MDGSYRDGLRPLGGSLSNALDKEDVFVDFDSLERGTPVGVVIEPGDPEHPDWAGARPVMDYSRPNITPQGRTTAVTEYLERDDSVDPTDEENHRGKPWRRTFFILDADTGEEYTTDFDQDGLPEGVFGAAEPGRTR
jgi:hypothetical protein